MADQKLIQLEYDKFDKSNPQEPKVRISINNGIDSLYNTNHIDDYTTTSVTYICQEDKDGIWRIEKIDSTGNFPVFTWASVLNNPTVTTYTAAYTARATTLVYGLYSQAF